MWSTFRKRDNSKKRVDSETLAEVPGRLPFNLFHRPKEIVGPAKGNRGDDSSTKISSAGNNRSCRNRPKVNLFPQISLTDLSDKDLNQVVDYMYSSDWKEASAYCARASCTNLGEMHQPMRIDGTDIKDTLSDRFRRRSDKVPYFDLPSSEVDLRKWYKSVV